MLEHLKKLTTFKNLIIYFVVHGVILIAVLFSVIRLMLPHVEHSLPQIEKVASESFGVEIHVEKMDTGWRGLGPVLRFENVTLFNQDTHQPLAQVHYFDVSLDLFASLRHLELVPGSLTLDGVDLIIEQLPDGKFQLKNNLASTDYSTLETLQNLLARFHRLNIKNGNLELDMKEGTPISLRLDYMTFAPRGTMYRFEAELSGKEIPARLKAIADIKGELDKLDSASLDGYLELTQVSYDPRFMPLKLYSIKPQAGNLDLDVWFRWEAGNWQQVIGKIGLNQVMLQNVKHPNMIQPLNLHGNIAWQNMGGDYWRLSGDDLVLQVGDQPSPSTSFLLEAGPTEPWNFRLNVVSVDTILDLLALSDQIDSKTREAIHQLNAQGELHDLQWLGRPTPEGFADWHLGIKLDELHWAPYNQIPAASHVSGEIKLSEHQGVFTLDSHDSVFEFPNLMDTPLKFDSIRGVLTWTYDKEWLIHTDQIQFVTPDTEITAVMKMMIPEDSTEAAIDLSLLTGEFNQEVAKKYLPNRVLDPAIINWINRSVENGRVTTMKTVVKGPLNKFPYKQGGGEYNMRFSLDEIDLKFHPAWPGLHHLKGELMIDGNGLQGTVDQGSLYGSTISNAQVSLPFAATPAPLMLHISGLLKGTTQDAEDFLRASPVWPRLNGIFDFVKIRGGLSLDVSTDIPLRGSMDLFKLQGSAGLTQGNVDIKDWKLTFEDVNGHVGFTQNSVNASNISGRFMDRPAILTANTVIKGKESEITWNLHSTLDKALVEKFAQSNFWTYFEGKTEYDASFKVYMPKREEPVSLLLTSNLKGISLNLPDPLGKTPDQALNSSVRLKFAGDQSLKTEIHLGPYFSGLLNFVKNKTGYNLAQGKIAAGSEITETAMPASGLLLTGHAESLALQQWTDFFANHQKKFPGQGSQSNMNLIVSDLKVDDLRYKDYQITHASLSAQRSSEQWVVDLNSDQLEGSLHLPHEPERNLTTLDFARCAWPLGKSSTSMSSLSPKDVVAVDLRCKQFKYKNSVIGQFHLGIHPDRQANSVSFEPISIESLTDKLTAKATWSQVNGQFTTHFKGETTTQNVGETLKGWGIPTDVQDAKGEAKFDFMWPGSPSDFSVKALAGELDVRMQNGRFVEVNPGFGRMLGLLSFQGLQRRLRLDFSDVFKSGFAFDSFKSFITLEGGNARTKNTSIKAPAADITLTGRSGLANHDLDLIMIVQAHIDSTVPAAAVAIANPAAGAAVWLVDKVFNPLGNMSRSRYHITGTWEKPEFEDQTQQYRKELEGPASVKEAS